VGALASALVDGPSSAEAATLYFAWDAILSQRQVASDRQVAGCQSKIIITLFTVPITTGFYRHIFDGSQVSF
jgi:hypothetical protein